MGLGKTIQNYSVAGSSFGAGRAGAVFGRGSLVNSIKLVARVREVVRAAVSFSSARRAPPRPRCSRSARWRRAMATPPRRRRRGLRASARFRERRGVASTAAGEAPRGASSRGIQRRAPAMTVLTYKGPPSASAKKPRRNCASLYTNDAGRRRRGGAPRGPLPRETSKTRLAPVECITHDLRVCHEQIAPCCEESAGSTASSTRATA